MKDDSFLGRSVKKMILKSIYLLSKRYWLENDNTIDCFRLEGLDFLFNYYLFDFLQTIMRLNSYTIQTPGLILIMKPLV